MPEKSRRNDEERKAKTLSLLEHICLRPVMGNGRIGRHDHYERDCYLLFKVVITNAIDEHIV